MKHILKDASAEQRGSMGRAAWGRDVLGTQMQGWDMERLFQGHGQARGWLGEGSGTWSQVECTPGSRANSPARCRPLHPAVLLGSVVPFPERILCLLKEMQTIAPLVTEGLAVSCLHLAPAAP